MPPAVAGMAHRVLTEALTNVRRHAPAATRVQIRVAHSRLGEEAAITVSVTNDGVPQPARPGGLNRRRHGGGFGLLGLRERVEALGGTLQARPAEQDGWQLTATIPAASESAAAARR